MEDALGIAMVWWATYGSLLIGVLYFLAAPRTASTFRRLLAAAYAPASAALFALACFLPRTAWSASLPLFPALQLIPLALFAVSLRLFPGPRSAHWVLAPFAITCFLWQAIWGYTFIHGK